MSISRDIIYGHSLLHALVRCLLIACPRRSSDRAALRRRPTRFDRIQGNTSMMKTGKVSLIAAATFIAALSLPRSVSAGEISGSWTGSAFGQTFQVVDGVPVPVSSFSAPAFLDITGGINGGDGEMTVGGDGFSVLVFGDRKSVV